MGLSYKSNFIGNTVIRLESIDSTNKFLDQYASKNSPVEGMVVIADYQSQGQGQNGRVWESKPGENLLLSIYLHPVFLNAVDGFFLNIITSLSIVDLLNEILEKNIAKVKWPNDVYVHDHKISGILIKNTISGQKLSETIIGIGMNVNQVQFGALKATSINVETAQEVDRNDVLSKLYFHLEKYYSLLSSGERNGLKRLYEECMYRRGEEHAFILEKGEKVKGTILGIKEDGRLIMNIDGKLHYFNNNTITYI